MPKKIINHLIPHYSDQYKYEICIDECARGTLCYSTCIGAVVLSRDLTQFCMDDIKDSKKFSSKIKLKQVAEYITHHESVLCHHICTIDVAEIDRINILQSVFKGMHECIRVILQKLSELENSYGRILNPFQDVLIMVDGDKFKNYCMFDEESECMREIPHITIEKGDSLYVGIACASIIAKNHHDDLIWDLCKQYPDLNNRYDLSNNVGYGTKKHLEGIRTHGISQWHRRTFGICKTSPLNPVSKIDEDHA